MAFTETVTARRNIFSNCHCWVWRMIDSLYYSSRKIPERCENSIVELRNKLRKALWVNEANHWRNEQTQCVVSNTWFRPMNRKSGRIYYLTNVTTIGMTSRVSQPVRFGAKRISRDTISLGALINNYCYGKSQAADQRTSSLFTYVRNQMANNSRFILVNCRY